MRLTNVLCQVNYHRHFKRIWKRQGKLEIKELVIPPELKAIGVEIKEGKDILNDTKLFNTPVKKVSRYPEKLLAPSVFSAEVPFYKMHSGIKVTEGENQAMALTKTVPYQGLPTEINSLVGRDSLPNQDELVKINILQAHVWDATQDKLPKQSHPTNPCYGCKRVYGIRADRKVSSLLEKLSYLCDVATGKYSKSLQRNKLLNTFCEVGINRNGSNVAFQMDCDVLLKSKDPLERFASPAEVKETENQTVPNIYPIKPTLDLDKCQKNPLRDHEMQYDPSFGSIHTLFLGQKTPDRWLPNQQLAKAVATCFAFTSAEARLKYGNDVKILPEPISIQCMFMDVQSANFLAYQLNTLDMHNNEGIKNQAWIDKPENFFSKVCEFEKILLTTYNPDVADYNPSIFSKMLAMHMNGL